MPSSHVEGCRLAEAHDGICRDGRDQPRILRTDGKVRSYRRTSGYGKVLEDLNALMGWKCRTTAIGLAERPELLTQVAAYRENKQQLQIVVDKALEIGGANKASDRGSAVHYLTELLDQGKQLGTLPEETASDLWAYEAVTTLAGLQIRGIEQFCVQDDLRCAGTFDRLVEFEGDTYIADLKTSSSISYPHSWAIQLAIYANSMLYDIEKRTRTHLPLVNRERAIIIWLPAGTGTCELHWIDIEAGWKAATDLVPLMEGWRSNKTILTPMEF